MKIELQKETTFEGKVWFILRCEGISPQVFYNEKEAVEAFTKLKNYHEENGNFSSKYETIISYESGSN